MITSSVPYLGCSYDSDDPKNPSPNGDSGHDYDSDDLVNLEQSKVGGPPRSDHFKFACAATKRRFRGHPPLRSPTSSPQCRGLAAGRGYVGALASLSLSFNSGRANQCSSSHSGARAVTVLIDARDWPSWARGMVRLVPLPHGCAQVTRRWLSDCATAARPGWSLARACAPHFGLWDRQPLALWPRPRLRSAGRRSEK